MNEDVFYQTEYKTLQKKQFTYYSSAPPITNTSATVTSLAPLTMYMLMFVAENGTSQVFCDQFTERDRTSSVFFVTTKNGGEYIITMSHACMYHLDLHCMLPLILWNTKCCPIFSMKRLQQQIVGLIQYRLFASRTVGPILMWNGMHASIPTRCFSATTFFE